MLEVKRIIKNFNKLVKVLLEFEMLYYRGWFRQVLVLCIILKKILNFIVYYFKRVDFFFVVFNFIDGCNVMQIEVVRLGFQVLFLIKYLEIAELFVNFDF